MLTPEQATKLTLAENLGVVSLIPRNPDDESMGDIATYTPEDIWEGSQRNTRAMEQGKDGVIADEPAVDHGPLASVVAAAEPPADPPFTMEVIERDTVRLLTFDRVTGKPIREASTASSAGPGVNSTGGVTSGNSELPTPSEGDVKLDDFPIDFDN
jgi:hypothetical protein